MISTLTEFNNLIFINILFAKTIVPRRRSKDHKKCVLHVGSIIFQYSFNIHYYVCNVIKAGVPIWNEYHCKYTFFRFLWVFFHAEVMNYDDCIPKLGGFFVVYAKITKEEEKNWGIPPKF